MAGAHGRRVPAPVLAGKEQNMEIKALRILRRSLSFPQTEVFRPGERIPTSPWSGVAFGEPVLSDGPDGRESVFATEVGTLVRGWDSLDWEGRTWYQLYRPSPSAARLRRWAKQDAARAAARAAAEREARATRVNEELSRWPRGRAAQRRVLQRVMGAP